MRKTDTAIFLHLYAQDLAQYFYEYLHPLKDLVDIHMTLPEDKDCSETEYMFKDLECTFNYVNNVGADNLSFLKLLNHYGKNYKYFFKLHTKKSLLHRSCNWREILVHELIGSREILTQNRILLGNGFIDSVGPLSLLMTTDRCHGDIIRSLMTELNIPKEHYSHFVGGSMFGGVSKTYLKYFNQDNIEHLEKLMLENHEVGQIKDGNQKQDCVATYHHSLERLFGYIGNLYPVTVPTITVEGIKSPKQIIMTRNKEVYCHHDIGIYGNVVDEDEDTISIIWKHKRPRVVEKYKKTSTSQITKVVS